MRTAGTSLRLGGLESAGASSSCLRLRSRFPSLPVLVATVVPMGLWLILAFVTAGSPPAGRSCRCSRAPDNQYSLVVPVSAAAAVLMMAS